MLTVTARFSFGGSGCRGTPPSTRGMLPACTQPQRRCPAIAGGRRTRDGRRTRAGGRREEALPAGNHPETRLQHSAARLVTMPLGQLQGFIVGVTADRRWEQQAELLERRGARVVHGPTIRTDYLAAEETVREATLRVLRRPPDVFVATT